MSSFTDFLKNEYAPHFNVMWDERTMYIRSVNPAPARFEIKDKENTILQPRGQGDSVLRRHDEAVEVVDLEMFTAMIHGMDNTPSCCDFVISPSVGTNYLLLNELTRTKSDYILPFAQQNNGLERSGKLEYAKEQLSKTINRFYEVSDFCDQYLQKIALFSCRLSDKRGDGIMARSARMFNKTIHTLEHLKLREKLPHGFIFKMRIYNAEYQLP